MEENLLCEGEGAFVLESGMEEQTLATHQIRASEAESI